MKKIVLIIFIVVLAGALLFGVNLVRKELESRKLEAAIETTETTQEAQQAIDNFKDEDFGQTSFLQVETEGQLQQTIHAMTHQKVKANEKWGFNLITPDKIDYLLQVLDKKDFKHEDLYRGILTEWKNGDFSNAVEAHNAIWELQDGNIGKAYGLMSPQEEKAYLEQYLKK